MIDLNIGSAGDWDGLNATFGTNGLPERQWPDYQAINLSNINGPWQPTPDLGTTEGPPRAQQLLSPARA